MVDPAFWARQRVLLTGHTGFKGSWTSLWLERMGAQVAGYALPPDQKPDLFSRLAPFAGASSTFADLADAEALGRVAEAFRPTIVLHMAAQPLVRRSYADPAGTFATNVQGTVNVLEAARRLGDVRAVLIVTTDKVYHVSGEGRPYREDDRLGGHDPYSASKAAAELATASYARAFLEGPGTATATARAGNVIGGGDWSEDRLVPDLWRARQSSEPIRLRYPDATRPWQHVLEPLSGYFLFLQRLAEEPDNVPRALNFGPACGADTLTVAEVIEEMQKIGGGAGWRRAEGKFSPETQVLALDSSKAMESIGWRPRLSIREALEWTADWYLRFDRGEDSRALTLAQIEAYEARG